MMKTLDLERVISAYVDGEIPQHKRAAVERLIEENELAGSYYRDFMQIRDTLRQLPKASAPLDFSQSVMQAIQTRSIPQSGQGNMLPRRIRIRRWLVTGIVSLSILLFVTIITIRSMNPVGSGRPDTVALRVTPVPESDSTPAVSPPEVLPAPVAPAPAVTPKPEKRNLLTAPAPLSVQGTGNHPNVVPTLDALLWVRCTPIASQQEKFVGEFLEYCMAQSLNFKTVGKNIYEFRLNRSSFGHFVQWLQSCPRTGGDVLVSDALKGWQTGNTSYTPKPVNSYQEVKPINMADELAIRFEIDVN